MRQQLNEQRESGGGMFPAPPGRERQLPYPDAGTPPEIPEHLTLHWDCFVQCLSDARGGPLAVSEVEAYCRLYAIEDVLVRDELLRMSMLLSAEFQREMEARAKKQQQTRERDARKASRKPWARRRAR